MSLIDLLLHPQLREFHGDPGEYVRVKRHLLDHHSAYRAIHEDWYRRMLKARLMHGEAYGEEIELGAGASVFKQFHPTIKTSDISGRVGNDLLIDAQDMALPDQSVASFYALDAFHHFHFPRAFFYELDRVLIDGGVCVLIEPYYGPFRSLIQKLSADMHRFDKNAIVWERTESGIGAYPNAALPYICFRRDVHLWNTEFPSLKLVERSPLPNFIASLASGSLGGRQILPTPCYHLLKLLEVAVRPLTHVFTTHQLIVIKKEQPC